MFLLAIEKNKKAIYRLCTVYASGPEDAKDIFQDILINIWRSLPSFQNRSAIDTWIYRISLNVCLQTKQKDDKRRKLFLNAGNTNLEHLHISAPPQKSYPELYNCINKLNETERPLILLYLEDLPYKQIAEITGLSENNIAVKIMRIKTKLSDCLNQNL